MHSQQNVQRVYSKTQKEGQMCHTMDQRDENILCFFFCILSLPSCSSSWDKAHLPAADSEKESKDIGLLLLVKFFDVFEGTHLCS